MTTMHNSLAGPIQAARVRLEQIVDETECRECRDEAIGQVIDEAIGQVHPRARRGALIELLQLEFLARLGTGSRPS